MLLLAGCLVLSSWLYLCTRWRDARRLEVHSLEAFCRWHIAHAAGCFMNSAPLVDGGPRSPCPQSWFSSIRRQPRAIRWAFQILQLFSASSYSWRRGLLLGDAELNAQ